MVIKKLTGLLAGMVFLANAGAAQALVLSFDPLEQIVDVGDLVAVDLRASGLGSGSAPSIGGFDIDVGYDSAVLDFVGASFGSELDFGAGSVGFSTLFFPGLVNLFELSFESPDVLDSQQADSFVLATLEFNALSLGASPLSIFPFAITDSLGGGLDASVLPGSVTVPAPASIALVVLGLLGMRVRKSRKNAAV